MRKMLHAITVTLLTLLYNTTVKAQGSVSFAETIIAGTSTPPCIIRFSYDNAGNRIRRDYYCEATSPFDPVGPGGVSGTVSVYPNPTSGTFNVYLSVRQLATITVSNMNGQSVAAAQSPGGETVTFDLSRQMPGNYIIKVVQGNNNQQFQITKL